MNQVVCASDPGRKQTLSDPQKETLERPFDRKYERFTDLFATDRVFVPIREITTFRLLRIFAKIRPTKSFLRLF